MISYNLEEALKSPELVTSLVLYRRSLAAWPESLFMFPNLQHLELDQCGITHLDKRLSQLPLHTLKLPRNEIANVPSWLSHLSHLTQLDLSENHITSWAAGEVPINLVFVRLANNKLSQLPDDLLAQVTRLDIRKNPLSQLTWPSPLSTLREIHLDRSPAAASRFLSCHAPELTKLTLTSSKLSALPEDLFVQFPKLTTLDLTGNGLDAFPIIWPSTVLLLERLVLAKNKLANLPEGWGKASNLRDIDLSRNQLSRLPDSFAHLPRLTRIDLSGNPLTELPDTWANLHDLKLLDIRKTGISRLLVGPWPRLEKLLIHETPVAHRIDILRSLPVRIRVTGKAQIQNQHSLSLHGFRKKAIQANWSATYQERLWQLAEDHMAGKHDRVSIPELLDLWSLGLPGIQERLISHSPGKRIHRGDHILIYGRTWLPISGLQKRAEQSGLILATGDPVLVRHVLIGGPQGDPNSLLPGQQTWWSEETILDKLPPLEPPRPAPKDHASQTIALLRSRISTYHAMAIQSMIDFGIPSELYGELFWIIRQNKLPSLKRKWPELVTQYGQVNWVVDCLKPKKDLLENMENLAEKWGLTPDVISHWSG